MIIRLEPIPLTKVWGGEKLSNIYGFSLSANSICLLTSFFLTRLVLVVFFVQADNKNDEEVIRVARIKIFIIFFIR